jgi:hypothetical protein
MAGPDVDSTHHDRPSGVARSFQVSEYPVSAPAAESRNVLSHDPKGSDFLDEPEHFRPEAGAGPLDAGALAGRADVLAGEAAADDIGIEPVLSESLRGEGLHVLVEPHVGPVLAEHAAGVAVLLAEGHGLMPARSRPREKPPMPENRSRTR